MAALAEEEEHAKKRVRTVTETTLSGRDNALERLKKYTVVVADTVRPFPCRAPRGACRMFPYFIVLPVVLPT